MRTLRTAALAAAALAMLAFSAAAWAQNFKDLEKQVVEKTLPNGLKVLILPRPQAPVTSFVTYADVGGVNEIQNATGLAHMFEHMAFKGTTTIGTLDIARKRPPWPKDTAFNALRAERLRRPKPDPEKLKQLETAFKKDQEEAQKFSDTGAFDKILEINGASGPNAAFTGFDQTVYHYSLPSNKLELWATLEADRFTNPVLREFYKEKDVVMEEKRMGESRPPGRLFNDFFPVAYSAAMYRSWVIGFMSDLQNHHPAAGHRLVQQALLRQEPHRGHRGRRGPQDGHAHPREIPGRDPRGPEARGPRHRGAATARREAPDHGGSGPAVPLHRLPPPRHQRPRQHGLRGPGRRPGRGRSSASTKPRQGEKAGPLHGCHAVLRGAKNFPASSPSWPWPTRARPTLRCEQAIYAELDKIQKEPVTAEELEGVKARAKMKFVDGLDATWASPCSSPWPRTSRATGARCSKYLDRVDAVTAGDITRVAKATFAKSNRTVGMIETTPAKAEK